MEKNIIRDSSVALKAFNNPKCSDVVFLVNDTKYYAYRKLVAGASTFFQTLLEGEFKESSQKEISLNNVMTYDNNFLIILSYIHGFEVNLKELGNLQVCELLHLTEYFDLSSLGDKVKTYLNNIEFYDIDFDSIAALINLAALESYAKLYKTAELFIFANVKYLLVHPSFLELDHDVLTTLLKSDSFYADEFEIFIAVLQWYDANSEDLTRSGAGSDLVSEANDDTKDTTSEDEGIGKSSPTTTTDKETKTVSTKLKELIKQIRNPSVDLFYLYKIMSDNKVANVCNKYQTELSDICSSSNEIKHVARKYLPVVFHVTIHDIERNENGSIKSGVYMVRNMEWKLKVRWSKQTNGVNVFLKCASSEKNWQCDVNCQINITSITAKTTPYYLKYSKYSFSPDNDEICKVPLIALSDLTSTDRTSYIRPDGTFQISVLIHPEDPIFN